MTATPTIRRRRRKILQKDSTAEKTQFSLPSLVAGIGILAVLLGAHAAGIGFIGLSFLFIVGCASLIAPPWRSRRKFLHAGTHILWAYCLALIATNIALYFIDGGNEAHFFLIFAAILTVPFLFVLIVWIVVRKMLPISPVRNTAITRGAYVLM